MSTGTTRAASAAALRNAKLKLVKLLYRDECCKAGAIGYGCFNLSTYSYKDLRRAYLKKLQVVHPDKIYGNSNGFDRNQFGEKQVKKDANLLFTKEEFKKKFQDLQSTWDRYEELSKSMTKVIQGDGTTANFTKFGVGCSFSDNDEEKALRREITDQACRGWFTSGLVPSGLAAKSDIDRDIDRNIRKSLPASDKLLYGVNSTKESLIDDSMFVNISMSQEKKEAASSPGTKTNRNPRYQRTLIPGIH